MAILVATIGAVVTFLLTAIAAAVVAPLTVIAGGESWSALAQVLTIMFVAGPLGIFVLGIVVASGERS